MQQDKRREGEGDWERDWETAEPKAKTEGGGQKMSVGRNGVQKRMHGVDKMDREGNSQEGKLEIWKEERLGQGG